MAALSSAYNRGTKVYKAKVVSVGVGINPSTGAQSKYAEAEYLVGGRQIRVYADSIATDTFRTLEDWKASMLKGIKGELDREIKISAERIASKYAEALAKASLLEE